MCERPLFKSNPGSGTGSPNPGSGTEPGSGQAETPPSPYGEPVTAPTVTVEETGTSVPTGPA